VVSDDTPAGGDSFLDSTDRNPLHHGTDRLPGTLTEVSEPEGSARIVPSSETPTVVAWLFREEAVPHQVALDEISALAADDTCFVWVDLNGYHPADLESIAQQLDLPDAAVRVARAAWQRPRVGIFRDRFFVAVTVPHVDSSSENIQASQLDLFVGRNYLVSAHKLPLPFTPQVLTRAIENPALLKLDSAFLLSILIDELLTHYEELTEGLEDAIEAMEERALIDASDVFLEDLLGLKRFVFAVYRLANQHRPLLEAILRPDFPLVGGDVIEPYFRDLNERLGRLVDGLEAARESVNGAFDLYVSQVSRRTNDIMKVLAIVSTMLLPATVILGFFGTQFENPPISTTAGFIVMVILIVLATAGALILFSRWGWLGQSATPPPPTFGRRRLAGEQRGKSRQRSPTP
jgi:magnesium transporter